MTARSAATASRFTFGLLFTGAAATFTAAAAQDELQGGFRPDPHRVEIQAGGSVDADDLAPGCPGYIASGETPDYSFNYAPTTYSLRIYAESSIDTTLIVNGPSGEWFCNDDESESSNLDPGLFFDDPQAGVYDVWVGAIGEGLSGRAVVSVSETDFPWGSSVETSSGTGFFVSSHGHLLTNHHVVDECSSISVERLGDTGLGATVVASNEAADLALLKVDAEPRAYAVFRSRPPLRLGEGVVVFGYPELGTVSPGGNLTTGVISGLSGYEGDLREFQFTAPIQDGSSGSPVMDASGHVIGIVVSALGGDDPTDPPQNVNWAVRGSMVRTFLDVNAVPYAQEASDEAASGVPEVAEAARAISVSLVCDYRP